MFKFKRKKLTVNECLKCIALLRCTNSNLREALDENATLIKKLAMEKDALIKRNEALTVELTNVKNLSSLQIEKEKDIIQRLNKQVYTLERSLGLR